MSASKPKNSPRSIYDEQASRAILRPAWSQPRQEISVRWPTPELEIDFCSSQQCLWSGVWSWSVSLNGKPLVCQSPAWELMCWEKNPEAVFLELQLCLSAGFRLQRQIMLARKDRFLLLADAVFGPERGMLAYQSSLPLGSGVQWRPAKVSREGMLRTTRNQALVLPLALPEWRAEQGVGELLQTEQFLTWSHASEGQALYAPLFFDLDPRRMAQPCTWRQLTVAESRCNVPRDVAAGFRVMSGKHPGKQWLIYRALGRNANRTLLGHNLSTEMLIGQFLPSGLVQPLVEIA